MRNLALVILSWCVRAEAEMSTSIQCPTPSQWLLASPPGAGAGPEHHQCWEKQKTSWWHFTCQAWGGVGDWGVGDVLSPHSSSMMFSHGTFPVLSPGIWTLCSSCLQMCSCTSPPAPANVPIPLLLSPLTVPPSWLLPTHIPNPATFLPDKSHPPPTDHLHP